MAHGIKTPIMLEKKIDIFFFFASSTEEGKFLNQN
jgi:hypothetical protein